MKNIRKFNESDSVLEDVIKQYLKDNLSISVNVETNDFMTTDSSTSTRFTVTLLLGDEEISSDSYTS
jgi:hypothetical protein